MPLDASTMILNGNARHTDVLQFVQLLTGTMTDQPVKISNTFNATGVTTLGSDVIVAGAIKFGTSGASTTTIYSPTANQISVTASGGLYVGGSLYFTPDGGYDIGATGASRPRNIFMTGGITAATFTATVSMATPLLTMTGTRARIVGDMTNLPTINRLQFQTSVANGITVIGVIPNGTATNTAINLSSAADPDNSAAMQLIATATTVQLMSSHIGTSTALPMVLGIDGGEAIHIRTDRHIGINNVGDPSIWFRLQTESANTSYGFQHIDATPDNIFYTRGDGYIYMRGPLNIGNSQATGTINLWGGVYLTSYIAGSDIRLSTNGLTVTPGHTSTADLTINGLTTFNGNAVMASTSTMQLSNTLNMTNATIQNVTTLYGVNNAVYLTNDGANWTFAGSVIVSGNLTSNYAVTAGTSFNIGGNTLTAASTTIIAASGNLCVNGTVLFLETGHNVYVAWNYGFQGGSINMSYPLYVNGAIQSSLQITAGNYVNCGGTCYIYYPAQYLQGAGAAVRFRMDNTGFLSMEANQGGNVGIQASAFVVTSALATKTNVVPLQDALSLVLDDTLHGVRYDERLTGEHRLGFVADPWLDVMPEAVGFDVEGGLFGLHYGAIGAVTFEALKQYATQTNARLDALERKLAA